MGRAESSARRSPWSQPPRRSRAHCGWPWHGGRSPHRHRLALDRTGAV